MRPSATRRTLLLSLLPAALLGACRPAANDYVAPPPPEVTVALPVTKTIPMTIDATGTTRGIQTVQVRARVEGFIQEKLITGGERVTAGDLLYRIDPRTFAATVEQAEAELATAEAELRFAELTVGRIASASDRGAATGYEVERTTAERDAAKARMDLAAARLESARLDLEFTEVRAPITGRVGIQTVDLGQLVGASDPTLLATVVNDSTIYATYTLDERQLLEQRQCYQNRRPGEDGRPDLVVMMGLVTDTGYPHEGRYRRTENEVDPATGTITAEAEFANPDGAIIPGLFVRLRAVLDEQEALLVPDTAVAADQAGRYVLVVNDEGVVERRNVTVGPVFDRLRRIDDGLEADARDIVNGMQRARPGIAVTALTEDGAAAGSTTGATGGAADAADAGAGAGAGKAAGTADASTGNALPGATGAAARKTEPAPVAGS